MRITERIVIAVVGVSCFVPIVEVAVMVVMLLTDHTRLMPTIIIVLLISVLVCWFPSVAYLVHQINRSDESSGTKSAWITYLVMWAPFVAPIVWYKYCLRRRA